MKSEDVMIKAIGKMHSGGNQLCVKKPSNKYYPQRKFFRKDLAPVHEELAAIK